MGSCTNSRIEDLRAFSRRHRGASKKADGVRVMVVPGSARVRLEAEAGGPRQGVHRLRCRMAFRRLLDVPGHEPRPARSRASAARRPRTATSKDARARAVARTWSRRWSPLPPPCAAPSRAHGTSRTRTTRSPKEACHGEDSPRCTGPIIPLRCSNVDTDQIIPARLLKRVTKTGFEDALFHGWRTRPRLHAEPARRTRTAASSVTGADFGTGSSREHAVWALRDFGFTAVLSPRFARDLQAATPASRGC